MITSKAELLDSTQRKIHADLVSSAAFRQGVAIALFEYQRQQAKLTDDNPKACAYRIQGAHQFVDVLLNLGNLPSAPQRKDHDNLTPTD